MKRNRNWEQAIASLVASLTFQEVAKRLGVNYQVARRIINEYGYKAVDGRKFGQVENRKLEPDKVDWRMSNVDIARQFGVSRERVRFVRNYLGKPKIESRGRRRKV